MKFRPKILLAFAVPTVVALLTGLFIYQALNQSLQTSARVAHTQEVIGRANAVIRDAGGVVSAVRGFAVTGDEAFLAPYTQAISDSKRNQADLRRLVSDNPSQVAQVDRMTELLDRYVGEVTDPVISATRDGDRARSARLVRTTGGPLIAELTKVGDDFIGAEQQLLATRTDASNRASRSAQRFVGLGLGLVVALTLAIGLVLSSRLSHNARAVTGAASGLAAGELDVRRLLEVLRENLPTQAVSRGGP